jgi:SAM-dependent methyltransferase
MYESIKKLVKSILPVSFIRKNDKLLRRVVSLSYGGDAHECNVCGFIMSKFIVLSNGNKLCPKCGSLPRTRKLWQIIESEVTGKEILHFSPSKSLRDRIASYSPKSYVTTDYDDEFEADKKHDIQAIEEPDNSFDLVICYHILEHIPNDRQAMSELYRVLKPGGICYIQTPFKEGDIYEDSSITTPEGRLEHFGQSDHLRIYSVEGLKARLEDVGFTVEVKKYTENADNRFGLKETEVVITTIK